MYQSGRSIAVVLAGVLLGMLLFPGFGAAEMIQAIVQPKEGESQAQSVERVKKQTLEDALYNKAVGMLPKKLPADRQKTLRAMIVANQKDFLRSVEVLDPEASGNLLVMDVIFDEQALSQKLRLSGLYYTLNKKRPFQLDLQGAAPEDKQELDGLIAASGLEPAVDVMPSLKLLKEEGVWNGTLDTGYGQFNEQGPQLEPVWKKLWAHYFASLAPAQKEEAPKNIQASKGVVIIRGFSSPDKIYVFDAVFGKWKSLVAQSKLQKIDMNTLGIEAEWEVEVFDQQGFADRMEGYIANSGLTYSWFGAE